MTEINDIPRWVVMWVLVGAVWIAFKVMAYAREGGAGTVSPAFFAWVGTDAVPYRYDRDASRGRIPNPWVPIIFIGFALTLLMGVAPQVENGIAVGWIGIVAMLCLLHFGIFDLLAAFWNLRGYPVEPIMRAPWAAATLGEFWGDRWNRAFSHWARANVFRPLVRKQGVVRGTMAGFLASGLAHEMVVSLPAGAGWGLPTLYFLLQSAGLLAQKRFHSLRRPLVTITCVLLPAPLLFHPAFLERVFAPMTRFFVAVF